MFPVIAFTFNLMENPRVKMKLNRVSDIAVNFRALVPNTVQYNNLVELQLKIY